MPVIKDQIKQEIKKLNEEVSKMEPDKAKERYNEGMAQIITDAILSAEVTPGISVTGSSVSGGPVTAKTSGKGSLK